jgi:uroporphyrinogen decarboxylase
VLETVRLISGQLPDATALIGFCGAPWTVATYMIEGGSSKDYSKTKQWAYGQPEVFQALMDKLVEASSAYLIAQIDAGAEAVQIFDSWAGVLPEAEFRRWVMAPIAAMVAKIKAVHPTVPVIGFPRGAGLLYEDFARDVGCDAVSLDTTVPLDWAAKVIQPLVTVQGNLDPIHLLTGGEAMDQAIDKILNTLGRGPFIFNLGHGITPPTPPENVARLADRIRAFR